MTRQSDDQWVLVLEEGDATDWTCQIRLPRQLLLVDALKPVKPFIAHSLNSPWRRFSRGHEAADHAVEEGGVGMRGEVVRNGDAFGLPRHDLQGVGEHAEGGADVAGEGLGGGVGGCVWCSQVEGGEEGGQVGTAGICGLRGGGAGAWDVVFVFVAGHGGGIVMVVRRVVMRLEAAKGQFAEGR